MNLNFTRCTEVTGTVWKPILPFYQLYFGCRSKIKIRAIPIVWKTHYGGGLLQYIPNAIHRSLIHLKNYLANEKNS